MNAYCVILSRQPFVNPAYPRTKRFYVGAQTADRAMRAASDQNPHFRVMGIEHSDLYPRLVQNDPSPSMWQAA
jgi:hypothetical protein